MEAPHASTVASSTSSDASYGDVHWSSRRSEHAEYHASHRHAKAYPQRTPSRPRSRPRDDSRGYGPTRYNSGEVPRYSSGEVPRYSSGELGRSNPARRSSSRQHGYASERSQTRPPPTRSSSRSGRADYVQDWAREASQTRQDRYSERGGSRSHREPRDFRERPRDRTPSQRGYRDPRDKYARDSSRPRGGRYESDLRDSRDAPPMSRSASHTSLASFGPGNPNPYASKPKQRVRPKELEPVRRTPAALTSPEPAKKLEPKDGLTTPSPTTGKKKWGLSMFSRSKGDAKEGDTEDDAKSPDENGIPGIDTPDGVDRAATGSLPREGLKALEGPSTELDRSTEDSGLEPDPLAEQDFSNRPSRQYSNRSALASQRRSRSGALEARSHSGYEDRRAGYEERRAGYEDRRTLQDERNMRSPIPRAAARPRANPPVPKSTPVDTDKLATPATFGKKATKSEKPVQGQEGEEAVASTSKRGWFSWGLRKGSSKALDTSATPSSSPEPSAGTPSETPTPPIPNGKASTTLVGTPHVGRIGGPSLAPATPALPSSARALPPSSPTSPFAAASKIASSGSSRSISNYEAHTVTTPGGVTYTSLCPRPSQPEPEPEAFSDSDAKDADIAAKLAHAEAVAGPGCFFCLGGGRARKPTSAGAQKS